MKKFKLKQNKKAYSVGFTWVFGLVTLFGLGILYITFNQVFEGHLVPTIKGMTDNSIPYMTQLDNETVATIHGGIDRYMNFFHLMPFILFLLVIIYMIIASLQKEREQSYL
jgi:hypothetical protein